MIQLKRRLLLIVTAVLITMVESYAVPAYPFPVEIIQPDGSTITVVRKGNQHFHYDVTEDGFLIKKDSNGIYRYATLNKKGEIVITQQKAQDKSKRTKQEIKFLKSLKTTSVSLPLIKKAKQQRIITQYNNFPKNNFPKTGSPKSLVILVNFANLRFVIDNPKEAFYKLLNEEGYSENGATGSARDYFIDNSMGVFSPEFDVVGPYTLTHNYEYYGKNQGNSEPNAVEMIVEACKLADEDGVDFTQYDTDNDGLIDNVFVYYAGHNEAEFGGNNTIWPHRFFVDPIKYTNAIYDGKRVFDYACTSELKNSNGKKMCGIGTFTHEFGHVLGLTDMYPTNGQGHYTLYHWDIMDQGPYLNKGRTPPGYNAWQRFRLGFMNPKLLENPETVYLTPINLSNEACLISSTNSHNLLGKNPVPTEFFLLENRQNIGWDKYLPSHGMIIYRINYDPINWEDNSPNNDPNAMGVDIIEADRIGSKGTLKGDPFPGINNITEYTPKLTSGVLLEKKKLTEIAENNKIISFDFRGGTRYEKILKCTQKNGVLKIFVPRVTKEDTQKDISVNIFDILGRTIFSTTTKEKIIEVSNLPKNKVVIIQANKQTKKVIIN